MKKRKFTYFLAVVLAIFTVLPLAYVFAGATLGNGGFESPIGETNFGNWNDTQGTSRVSSATIQGLGFSATPEGNFALQVPAGTFTFQLTDAVGEGDFVVFSTLAESNIAPASGGRMKIEFKRLNEDGTDTLIEQIESPRINTGNAPAGGGFTRFTISGAAPAGTRRIAFVFDGNGAGSTIFDDVSAAINPAELAFSSSKSHVKAGEFITMFAEFTNRTGAPLNNVNFIMDIPPGFDTIFDSVRLNGNKVGAREGSLVVPVGTVAGGARTTISFQVFVTSGVTIGKQYDFGMRVFNGSNLSGNRRIRVIVEEDPVFDQGTIIGKVFHDRNGDGVQEPGEEGIPWVRLVTEEGVVVITDQFGRYHIPGVKEGRHIVKIDGHTLPEGTEFITEESYLVKTTAGILNKANFAVKLPPSKIPQEFQSDLSVRVTQGLDTTKPRLDVKMIPELLGQGLGVLETEPVFKFDINYADFIKRWYLEIRDELGREVWTGFGVLNPPSEVRWSGKTEEGLLIKPGVYSYQFKVEDKAGNLDWSPLHFFRVVSKQSGAYLKDNAFEIPPVGDFNLFKNGARSIPLVAKPTIRIQGTTKPDYKVRVNDFPVPVDPNSGVFQTEVYTSPGEKNIFVTATSPDGETTTYKEIVQVKDSMFFMVGLAEGELGLNFTDGNLETAGNDRRYKNKFYSDGRVSYYLKGKIRGKFLVKSHYDTDDKRSALFTNLDPDEYYPVYGDASSRDYEAHGSRDRFFIIIEMDRSYVKWGSFQTEFTDTELGTYNRTLHGLKVNYDTVMSTPYGEPVRGFKAFWNEANHRADHNEFFSTGGKLYYLRNRRVVEGSEKVRIEIRDKIQDVSIESYDLTEGVDYEIDYNAGRILLTDPPGSKAATDTLSNNDILGGNDVFVVVDYEFDGGLDLFENANRGIRGYTHMGDHLRIGATYVEEIRDRARYDLRSIDMRIKIGRNTKIFAEYAESFGGSQTNQSVSFNGGLSFQDLDVIRGEHSRKRENAYIIKAESKPVKNLEVSGFVQAVEPGFSNEHIRSQEGFKKYGVAAKYKINDDAYIRYRYDSNEVVGQLLPLSQGSLAAPFETFTSHLGQAVYDDGEWLAEAEFKHQKTDLPGGSNLLPTILSEEPFENAIAARFGRYINDRLLGYVKGQVSIKGEANNQFGGGFRYEIIKGVFAYLEQMVGNIGDSTYFGFEKQHPNGGRSYASLRSFDRGIGSRSLSTAVGSSFKLTEKSRFFSEREYATYNGQEGFAEIFGVDGQLNDRWDYEAKFERRHLDNNTFRLLDVSAENSIIRSNTYTTISGGLGYNDGQRFKAKTYLEVRRDSDTPKLWQWVSRSFVEYKVNNSLGLLGRLNYGKTFFNDPDDIPADFMELSTGFAYRPVDNDKLNVLGRYTYLRDIHNDIQFSTPLFSGVATDEKAHIFSIEFAYDVYKYLGIVEKLAFKRGIFKAATNSDNLVANHFLWIHRFNFHVTRKWDIAVEYRALWQSEAADTLRHGALIEVDREFYDYVRLGVGYDFTDFDDDLRKTNDFDSHGPFVRLTGKF